jgi:DNA-binding GntR family transcriptional regulator
MKNETLSERIFTKLKDDILSGAYVPGERLLYEKVAERLGVSMTPLKDAFHKLEQEGLVNNVPRRGCFVTRLDDEDIVEYCQIRWALESLAASLICGRSCVPEAEIGELAKINERIARAIKRKKPRECIVHDAQFHLTLVSMSGNKRLLQMLHQFPLSNLLVLMGRGEKNIENGDVVIEDHARIIEALKVRDEALIMKILEKNIFVPYNQIIEEHE